MAIVADKFGEFAVAEKKGIRVMIESPYGCSDPGLVELHTLYARLCLAHSIREGEAPFASHLLYPQVLDDRDPEERRKGVALGLRWASVADKIVFCVDLGVSTGMWEMERWAQHNKIPTQDRHLSRLPEFKDLIESYDREASRFLERAEFRMRLENMREE